MSPAIEAVRALADGGPTLWPVLQSLAWVVGLIAVFGPIAVRGYRVAAGSGAWRDRHKFMEILASRVLSGRPTTSDR